MTHRNAKPIRQARTSSFLRKRTRIAEMLRTPAARLWFCPD